MKRTILEFTTHTLALMFFIGCLGVVVVVTLMFFFRDLDINILLTVSSLISVVAFVSGSVVSGGIKEFFGAVDNVLSVGSLLP